MIRRKKHRVLKRVGLALTMLVAAVVVARALLVYPIPTTPQTSQPVFTVDPATGLQGVAITGAAMPTGGRAELGWLSAIWKQLSTGITVNAGTNLNTSALALEAGGNLAATATELGALGSTACATDTGSCNINAFMQRLAQRVTSLIAAVGSPVQAGAAIDQGCAGQTNANTQTTPINNAGSATSLKLVSAVSAKKVYVCAINVGPVAGAVNTSLVEGTKTTTECDTSTAGMAGGATAATGWNIAANGGLTLGNGVGKLATTATANRDVCLLFSTGVQVSGTITWAQF